MGGGFLLFWLALGRLMTCQRCWQKGLLLQLSWATEGISRQDPMTAHAKAVAVHAKESVVAICAAVLFAVQRQLRQAGSHLNALEERGGACTRLGGRAHLHLLNGQQRIQSGTRHL